MSTTSGMKVEIDDRIRANPELLRAVTEATEYLRGLPTRTPPPAVVHWGYTGPTGDTVELSLSDDVADPRSMTSTTRPPKLYGHSNRDSFVRWAWISLLNVRSDGVHARINQLWEQYDREGGDAE